MYMRLARFTLGPGKSAVVKGIEDEIVPLIASQPGCQGVTLFGDDADGEYGIAVVWDTEDHANAAQAVVGPKLFGEHLEGHVQQPPERRLFPIIAHLPGSK
jgi:heme-degrading monooxygenase HmoA